MEIIFSKRFRKQAKKLVENKPNRKPKINEAIKDFSIHKRQSQFYRKRLKGNWYGYEELEIGGDIRIIFRLKEDQSQAVLERIGTHAQLDL